MEKLEPLYTAGKNVKCFSFFGKQFSKLTDLLYDPEIPLLGIYPKELKIQVQTKSYTQQPWLVWLSGWSTGL